MYVFFTEMERLAPHTHVHWYHLNRSAIHHSTTDTDLRQWRLYNHQRQREPSIYKCKCTADEIDDYYGP